MGRILYIKEKPTWPARVAFATAAAGVAMAAWFFTKSDYEPVRLLTPEEQEVLRKDAMRNPPPRNWEDSFIREKVPGEDRAEEGNAWTRAAEAKPDPGDPWTPRDEIEKRICDQVSLERYRSAQKAWVSYQARPATAKERYDLLTDVYYTQHAVEMTGLDRNQLSILYGDAAKAALEEARVQPVPADPSEAQNYYGRMLSYLEASKYSWGHTEERESFQVLRSQLEAEMGRLSDKSRDQKIGNFIKLYRQGIKPGIEGIRQYEQIADGVGIDIYLWRQIPEESDSDYEIFMKYREQWDISLDEAKGIAAFLARMYDFLEEKYERSQAEAEHFRNTRSIESCRP